MFYVENSDLQLTGRAIAPTFSCAAGVGGGIGAPLASVEFLAGAWGESEAETMPPPHLKLSVWFTPVTDATLPPDFSESTPATARDNTYWLSDSGIYVVGTAPPASLRKTTTAYIQWGAISGNEATIDVGSLSVERVSFRGINLPFGQVGGVAFVDLCCQCYKFVGGEGLTVEGTATATEWMRVATAYFFQLSSTGLVELVEWAGLTFSRLRSPELEPGTFAHDRTTRVLKLFST